MSISQLEQFNKFYKNLVNKKFLEGISLKNFFKIKSYFTWSYFDSIIKGYSSLLYFYGFDLFENIVLKDNIKKHNRLKIIIFNTCFIKAFIKIKTYLRKLAKLSKADKSKADILIISSDRFSGKTAEDNLIFGPLIKKLRNKGFKIKLIEYDNIEYFNLFSNLRKWLFRKDFNFIGQYYDKTYFKEVNDLENEIKNIYFKELRGNKEFVSLFRYKNKEFYSLMEPQMDIVFKLVPYYVANGIIGTKKILERERPKAVIVDSEGNLYSKSLIQNARKMGIKSIALQFGTIQKELSDIPINNEIFPDIKCVDGPQDKYNLIRYYNYPTEIIKITGEPRYDSLVNNEWNKQMILKEIGLNPYKKTILYIDDGEGTKSFVNDVFLAFKELKSNKNLQFIIKLHPLSLYNLNLFKRLKGDNVRILKKFNTSKLVVSSDVVVLWASTVSIEAIINNKPLIMVKFDKDPKKWFDFDKEGSALRAYSKEELIKYINRCLYDTKMQEKLAGGRKVTLKKHYCSSLGKASELIIKELKNMLK